MRLLEVRDVVKTYGKRRVVNQVSFHLDGGEIVGLLGPNGAGKTTTFLMAVGMVRPESGQVLFKGRDVTHLPMYRRARLGLGYLSQERSDFRKLSVEQNILAILEAQPLRRSERKRKLEELLDELDLHNLRKNRADTLSGGERRRLEITRALASDPELILLDEPFAGVDPIAVAETQDIVRSLKERGIGVLLTDHNVRETLSITDRTYIIAEGRIIKHGDAADLVNDPTVRRVYLGKKFSMLDQGIPFTSEEVLEGAEAQGGPAPRGRGPSARPASPEEEREPLYRAVQDEAMRKQRRRAPRKRRKAPPSDPDRSRGASD
jgi:lipopolysaccharide export system ATP-binding protein